jgi:hypothetical protein
MRDVTGAILATGGAVTVELLKRNLSVQQGIRIAGSLAAETLKDFARRRFSPNEVAAYLAISAAYEVLGTPFIADMKVKYPSIFPNVSDRELQLIAHSTFTMMASYASREIGLFPPKSPIEIASDVAASVAGRYAADKYV